MLSTPTPNNTLQSYALNQTISLFCFAVIMGHESTLSAITRQLMECTGWRLFSHFQNDSAKVIKAFDKFADSSAQHNAREFRATWTRLLRCATTRCNWMPNGWQWLVKVPPSRAA